MIEEYPAGRPSVLGPCEADECPNDGVITCRFQRLGFARLGADFVRAKRVVERTWCWPCFAEWTLVVRSLSRKAFGLSAQVVTAGIEA
ncbi:MAG: hypothetical protein WEE66_02450 [Actinomycetota bacterium]